MAGTTDTGITIAHIVHRFDVGGLENGIVNLINASEGSDLNHHIVALTEITDLSARIRGRNVGLHELRKRPGKDPIFYVRLLRVLREIRPDIVHTRNWGTLDCIPIAWLAGVRSIIHGEHGWDVNDPDGRVGKYRWMRLAVNPFVVRFVTLSRELEKWLTDVIGINKRKVTRICNGVDTDRITPRDTRSSGELVFGTVTRFSTIKNPNALIEYFAALIHAPRRRDVALKLLMVGDGPLLSETKRLTHELGLTDFVRFAGRQLDILPYLHQMDVFALTSRREGISNTILEAMAAGLPVMANRTGGNPELVTDGETGYLFKNGDSDNWVSSMLSYVDSPELIVEHGDNARRKVATEFTLQSMIQKYLDLYRNIYFKKGNF